MHSDADSNFILVSNQRSNHKYKWYILFYTAWNVVKDVGNHGLPLFCLLVELFFNQMPFISKHIKYVMIIGAFYLFVNLSTSCSIQFILLL